MDRGVGMLMSVHLVSSEQQYAGRHAYVCDKASIPSPLHGYRGTYDGHDVYMRATAMHGMLGYI